jgi:hypothetical protein
MHGKRKNGEGGIPAFRTAADVVVVVEQLEIVGNLLLLFFFRRHDRRRMNPSFSLFLPLPLSLHVDIYLYCQNSIEGLNKPPPSAEMNSFFTLSEYFFFYPVRILPQLLHCNLPIFTNLQTNLFVLDRFKLQPPNNNKRSPQKILPKPSFPQFTMMIHAFQ